MVYLPRTASPGFHGRIGLSRAIKKLSELGLLPEDESDDRLGRSLDSFFSMSARAAHELFKDVVELVERS